MKQTFNIPEGCKTVSVEQVGNQIITSFEPEKYVPKKGDLVRVSSPVFRNIFIFECAGRNKSGEPLEAGDTIFNGSLEKKDHVGHCIKSTYTKLTPEEFQAEFEKLGYVYDFETHTAHKKRWRAEEGSYYFYVDFEYDVLNSQDSRDSVDNRLFKNGNYFKSKSDAEKFSEIIKKQAINFHKNNQ